MQKGIWKDVRHLPESIKTGNENGFGFGFGLRSRGIDEN